MGEPGRLRDQLVILLVGPLDLAGGPHSRTDGGLDKELDGRL